MRIIIVLALFINASVFAQIKGNKSLETRTFSAKNLNWLKVNLYAEITLDYAAKEQIKITTDGNLFDFIDTNIVDGKLDLNQLQWIQPSEKIKIEIGAPNIKRVEIGTHETLQIINIDTDKLHLMAPLGKILAVGKVKQLNIGIENGEINASKLISEKVTANIWGFGKAIVFAKQELYATIKKEGKLTVVNTPKQLKGDARKAIVKTQTLTPKNTSWINFTIKNNSWNRNNFFVIGPKNDGSKFSYGFPMMPGATREENWSVGTKIYKVNKLGLRKLLVKIKDTDKDKVVKLF